MCRKRVTRARFRRLVLVAMLAGIGAAIAGPARADDPWIITTPVTITQPTDLGDVIVASGGRLTVENVPDPGVRLTGNLMVVGHGSVVLKDSVIQFMSTYNGQYVFVVTDDGSALISGCDYRVPNRVQHALFAGGRGSIEITGTDFGNVQLVAAEDSHIEATRLDGNFEVILQERGAITLEDIPRDPGRGTLWVWPEFPAGSTAVYTPPEPGFIESWNFPPPDVVGIPDTCHLQRCQVLLWPMLVKEGADLTLRDIPEENRVIVGLHLPHAETITGLENNRTYANERLPLADRTIRLENASIDTWNLYPENGANVTVRDSVIGEMITFGGAHSVLENTTVDGSGGYFGATATSVSIARNCTFTCDIQASDDATIELHGCRIKPYPQDTDGIITRIGAFDRARLLVDTSEVSTNPVLGGQGLIAGTWIENPPRVPPVPGVALGLYGIASLFTLPGGPAPGSWKLEAVDADGHVLSVLGSGSTSGDRRLLGIWAGARAAKTSGLELVLTDGWGRTLAGSVDLATIARRSSRSVRPVTKMR